MVKSILILGGGTSGLVSALIIKSIYQKIDIKIIKSSDIGIIGVGEGSTEHWSRFMAVTGISLYDLIRETDATFKTGIKFVNWNGDRDYYFHSIHSAYLKENFVGIPYAYPGMIAKGLDHHAMVPKNIHESVHYEPLESSVNQFHFNTMKLNDYLLKLCSERDIEIIDDIIEDVSVDERGYVKSLISTNKSYFADLFLDCSGFKRIISSKLGAKWVDCSEFLPMNAAIAFPTEKKEEIPSHTISTAMSSGWMWRIPTQERFGNGYVYSDNFLSLDQAITEAQSCFDHPIEIAKKFNFTAGYVDKFWIKNCISVGLAGSFVEPLEASSIGTSIQQALAIASHLPSYDKTNNKIAEIYNIEFESVAKNIIDFVQLHYITKRRDTDFWKSCADIKLTDFNRDTLPLFQKRIPTPSFFARPFLLFRDANWIMVMHGLGLFDQKEIADHVFNQNEDILFSINDIIEDTTKYINSQTMLSHRQTLLELMDRNSVQVFNFEGKKEL